MKKLILTTVCAMAMAGVASAQYLNWNTISFSAMTAQTNATVYSPLFGGGAANGNAGATATAANGFYYELLYGGVWTTSGSGLGNIAGANSPSNSFANLFGGTWLDTGLEANNSSASAGRLVNIGATVGASVPWNAGQTDNIVLVGWSANLGTSWFTVSNELATGSYIGVLAGANGFFGVTSTGYLTSGASSSSGVTVFATGGVGSSGLPILSLATPLYLLPVPEPATIALAGLGGLAMLAFRRQRK